VLLLVGVVVLLSVEGTSLLGNEDQALIQPATDLLSDDTLSAHMMGWTMLWHKHFNDVRKIQMTEPPTELISTEVGTTAETDAPPYPPTDRQSAEWFQEQVQKLQKVQDMMKDRLRVYWEFLSNSTLNHQPYPKAKNAELHSDGILNHVLTASLEFDHAEDEDKLISKYWLRWSSDCTDMGKINPTLPPIHILQVDAYVQRYRTVLGPISVPEGAQCLLLYAADFEGQPYPEPVPLLLPQFRYPKPEFDIVSKCQVGWDGCFERNSTGTSCESLLGKNCCSYPMCVGCKECSQVRNLEPVQLRPRLHGLAPPCTDRWERQGFSQKFGFTCAQAISWGTMTCFQDKTIRLCFRTCAMCDPRRYPDRAPPVVLPDVAFTMGQRPPGSGGSSPPAPDAGGRPVNEGRADSSPALPGHALLNDALLNDAMMND
jgi:hypothetical protein